MIETIVGTVALLLVLALFILCILFVSGTRDFGPVPRRLDQLLDFMEVIIDQNTTLREDIARLAGDIDEVRAEINDIQSWQSMMVDDAAELKQ
jgi:hypothetical protein